MPLEHKHLIVRAEVNTPPVSETLATSWVKQLVASINMKILMGPYAKYLDVEGTRGLTVVTIIETSHIALHVWDECSPALLQLDVYTCGSLEPTMILESLSEFDPVKIEYKYLDREHGLQELS
jgi:S-adenosylmethionine/arginine decarboxylase-like enzyme